MPTTFFASRWVPGIGADIMGRNMFGPQRGPWEDPNWKGWWGDNPPYHNPVFVLTHHPRPSIEMEGGTTFHFIDASPADALAIARDAARELDVRIGGGPSTIRQFLTAGLVDHLHAVIVPIVLGRGEPLWQSQEALEELRHRVGDHPERRDPPGLQPPIGTTSPSTQIRMKGAVGRHDSTKSSCQLAGTRPAGPGTG